MAAWGVPDIASAPAAAGVALVRELQQCEVAVGIGCDKGTPTSPVVNGIGYWAVTSLMAATAPALYGK